MRFSDSNKIYNLNRKTSLKFVEEDDEKKIDLDFKGSKSEKSEEEEEEEEEKENENERTSGTTDHEFNFFNLSKLKLFQNGINSIDKLSKKNMRKNPMFPINLKKNSSPFSSF